LLLEFSNNRKGRRGRKDANQVFRTSDKEMKKKDHFRMGWGGVRNMTFQNYSAKIKDSMVDC